jgi:glucokinase
MREKHTNGLVFNIGGTSLRSAMYIPKDKSLSVVKRYDTPSYIKFPNYSAELLIETLICDILAVKQEIFGDDEPSFVSVAFAAPIDKDGRAILVPTILGDSYQNPIPLKNLLEKIFSSSSVYTLNDVTAAGYRYIEESEDLCILTIGSGIGSKVFISGKPLLGENYQGGELGHLRVDYSENAIQCDCGGLGHLASVASGRGVLQTILRLSRIQPDSLPNIYHDNLSTTTGFSINNSLIVKAFLDGDQWTCNIIKNSVNYLGQTIASIHLTTGIEKIIVAGGFALALGETYRKQLVEAASASCWDQQQDWNSMIQLGEPDDCDSLIGAGKYATNLMHSTSSKNI